MFQKASRMKLRFDYRGVLSVEDLWDLSVRELDDIYKSLNQKLKASQEDSLLGKKSKEDEVLALKVEIIKTVVATLLQEAEDRKTMRKRIEEKEKIMGIMAGKQDAELQGMSMEELQKKLDGLG